MATVYGNVVNSGYNGGWRSTVSYSIYNEDATSVIVSVYDIGFIAVRTSTSWFDCTSSSSQTLKVGSNTVTNRKFELNDYFLGDDRVGVLWYSSKSGSTIYVLNYQITLAKGHTETTQSITASIALGSGWTMYDDVSWTERTISGTSSISIPITVPALASYTVSLDAQGGTGAPATLTKWHGEALPLPQPVKDGFSFSGWAKSSAPTTVVYPPGTSYALNADVSLVAVYSPIITSATITQLYAARDDGSFTWDSQTGTHTSASDDGEYVYIRAWWRVDGAAAATISLDASMADSSTVWTGATRQVSKPGTGELYIEGVAEWGTTQTALVTGQYDVTVGLSTGAGNPSDSRGTTVSTAFFTIDVLAGGHGIAFGKPATQQLFDVGMETNFDQDVTIGGDLAADGDLVAASLSTTGDVSGVDVIASNDVSAGNTVRIMQSNGSEARLTASTTGTFVADTYDQGEPKWRFYMSSAGSIARQQWDSSTSSWGTAEYYRFGTISIANGGTGQTSANAAARALGMAKTAGDSITMSGIIVNGFLTNAKKSAYVSVPLPCRLYGVNSTTVSGTVTVRGSGLYLFGSTSDTPRSLSALSPTVTAYAAGFVRIAWTGSEQAAATNNTPISIQFNTLTITFR